MKPSVETIVEKMAEQMYNPMEQGLVNFTCKLSFEQRKPFPFSLIFSLKMKKGKEPELELIRVKPLEFQEFVDDIGKTLTRTVFQLFMKSFSDDILNKNNNVSIVQEEDLLLLKMKSKKEKGPRKKFWLRDYIVVKKSEIAYIPDRTNPSSFRKVENVTEFTWKETEREHCIVDKMFTQDVIGENEMHFEYEEVKGFTVLKSMVYISKLGETFFNFSDYIVNEKI